MLPARHLSAPIARPAAEMDAFASRPENLARWASGLGAITGRGGSGSRSLVAVFLAVGLTGNLAWLGVRKVRGRG